MRALLLALFVILPMSAQAQTRDACALLDRHEGWRAALVAAQEAWRVSPGTILAVLDQESRFNAYARGQGGDGANPPRNFGFAQANLQTWNWFLRDTNRQGGARTDFALSAQFVGWHFATMERRLGPARSNIVEQYLIYKMGEGGYRRGAGPSARNLANVVASRARQFDAQWERCGAE